MVKQFITLSALLLMVVGCQTNEEGVPNREQSVGEEMHVKNDELKKYTQSLERGVAEDGYKQEYFSSDEQREIEQHIIQMEEVTTVYAEVFDEQLNISVSVKEGPYEAIEDAIYTFLDKRFPGRNVEVFVVQSTG